MSSPRFVEQDRGRHSICWECGTEITNINMSNLSHFYLKDTFDLCHSQILYFPLPAGQLFVTTNIVWLYLTFRHPGCQCLRTAWRQSIVLFKEVDDRSSPSAHDGFIYTTCDMLWLQLSGVRALKTHHVQSIVFKHFSHNRSAQVGWH